MKLSIQLYRCYALLLLLMMMGGRPMANQQSGADLTWTCDPQNPCLYTLTYTLYGDCNGFGSFSFPPEMDWGCPLDPFATKPTSTTPNLPNNGWTAVGPPTELTMLCPSQVTDCNGGSVPGVLRQDFTQTFDFCSSNPCEQYVISWSKCCRSNLITNSVPHPVNNIYDYVVTETVFGFDQSACNNSPTFSTDGVIWICQDQPTTVNLGASDPDPNDVLSYNMTACRDLKFIDGSIIDVNYLPGYSEFNPLGPDWTVTLAQNGDLTFTPDPGGGSAEIAVLCVQVIEERDGVVVGVTVRDMQVRTAGKCANNLPTLSGINGTPFYDIKGCVGDSMCIEITSDDADAADILTVSILQNVPSAAVTQTQTPRPTTTICWLPSAAGLYTIEMEVRDDACPMNGVQNYTYSVEIDDCPPQDPCDSLNLAASFTHTQNLLDITVQNTSSGGPITFTEYYWGDTPGNQPEVYLGNHTAPVNHTFPGPGTYEVCVKILSYYNNLCCHDSVCKMITVVSNPCDEHTAAFNYSYDGVGCNYTFTDVSTPGSSGTLWDFGFGQGPLLPGSPISVTFPGNGTYTVTMTSFYYPPTNPTLCCTSSVTQNVPISCFFDQFGGGKDKKTSWVAVQQGLTVDPAVAPGEEVRIQLYDLQGKLLKEKIDRSGGVVQFDLQGWSVGIYLVRIIHGESVTTHKFLKD